jgi:transposase InsO family protein
MSATAARREELKTKIAALFELFDAVYGYRRIHAELVRDGEHVSAELVRKLMRQLELYPCQPRPYRTTTIRGGQEPAGADLIGRDFGADRPGTKLVGDITYIRTWEGWLYLATVIDCFNREVIGYAMADHMRTDLITDALAMAARNHTVEPGCIFHSDRGSQPRLNRWTQHPDRGGVDGASARVDGHAVGTAGDEVARTAADSSRG